MKFEIYNPAIERTAIKNINIIFIVSDSAEATTSITTIQESTEAEAITTVPTYHETTTTHLKTTSGTCITGQKLLYTLHGVLSISS